jgi:hypothetical protein
VIEREREREGEERERKIGRERDRTRPSASAWQPVSEMPLVASVRRFTCVALFFHRKRL